MVLRILTFFTASLIVFSCKNTTSKETIQAQETPAEKAASLYSMHCAQCHGEDGKLGSSGAKDLSKSQLTDQEIILMIKKGKNAMPPMEALLENQENISLVAKHVKGLRK